MNETDRICEILDEINQHLEEYEKETISIISCDVDEIEGHTAERVEITKKIRHCFDLTDEICKEIPQGEEIKKIIKNKAVFSEISQNLENVFRKSEKIHSVYTRIKDSEVQAVDRINREKEEILVNIKKTNNGQQAKAAKFAVGLDDGARKHLGSGVKNV